MPSLFSKPLYVGKSDTYSFTFSPQWADGASLELVNGVQETKITVPDGGASVSGLAVDGLTVQARFLGVMPGRHTVHCEAVLSDGRSDCTTGILTVSSC